LHYVLGTHGIWASRFALCQTFNSQFLPIHAEPAAGRNLALLLNHNNFVMIVGDMLSLKQ